DQHGWLAPVLGPLLSRLTDRYLAMEAAGLKRRSEARRPKTPRPDTAVRADGRSRCRRQTVPTSDRAAGFIRRHEDDERAKWRRGVPEGGIPLRDLDRALLEGVEVVRDALHPGHET